MKIKNYILYFLFLQTTTIYSQIKSEEVVFTIVEEVPVYPGGSQEMNKFIQKNLVLPQAAIKNNTFGKCFTKFIVRKDSTISDITVLKGVPNCPECDEEAKRVLSMMPKWAPARQNGRAVNYYITQAITFQLK